MALRVQSSFAAGELDPALHERTNFDKYQSGLATGRNVVIGKSGRILNRPGRKYFKTCKLTNTRCILYSPPGSGYLVEWGHQYVRSYIIDATRTGASYGALAGEDAHALTETDLDNITFDYNGGYVWVFCVGKTTLQYFPGPGTGFVASPFTITTAPVSATVTNTSTGYACDYAVTVVRGGQESDLLKVYTTGGGTSTLLPLSAAEYTSIDCLLGATAGQTITEARVYRRPHNASAYGFVGRAQYLYAAGANTRAIFNDVGGDADYTHSPPTLTDSSYRRGAAGPSAFLARTGVFYQQRLVLTDYAYPEALEASRPAFANNFYRNYPIDDDSSIAFRSGSGGNAVVLRLIDHDGLVVFTTRGIFVHSGQLSPTNLSLLKKGNWVIDYTVPPLSIPGGVMFLDASTNVVRILSWSTEYASFSGEEVSIFSNHLFEQNTLASWGLHEGVTPVTWVVFDDGTFGSFTYERDQQMKAWTRCDSPDVTVEYVVGTGVPEISAFLVEKDGYRYIELTESRYVSASDKLDNPEYDKLEQNFPMDSRVSYSTLLNDSLAGTDTIQVTPNSAGVWDDSLTITCGTSAIFTATTSGLVGAILRFFDPNDGTTVDLEVTARASDNQITVMPSCEFPETSSDDPRIYLTSTFVTGLSHMEGEYPSVAVDGYVVCSPNNDIENYEAVQVVGGSLTLPGGMSGAIIHVGRAFTCDTETLDVDTVEQRPITVESKIVNKVYVKHYRTRGLYVGAEFPDNDKVNGLEDLDAIEVDYESDEEGLILGNRFQAPTTKRTEVTIPGDWKSNGRICIRQVDPVNFEILSIIPDIDDQRR